jgi:aryl-alcohol dehydrogenase-like predicted oxidoreductase
MDAAADFLHRDLRPLGRRVHRLGLAGNYGIDEAGVKTALDAGINYLYFGNRGGALARPLTGLNADQREKLVVAAGPLLGFFGGSVRRSCERLLKRLGTPYIDIFQLYWVGTTSAWTDATVGELVKLKAEGKVKSVGISIHDRPRAAKLAQTDPLDVLMLRYNASHPGAEREVFPHIQTQRQSVIAYTATDWGRLLKRPRGWDGPVPTAGDCYRFCLSSPSVDVVLTGPKTAQQLQENLAAVQKGPLAGEELEAMRKFGKVVHG